MRDQAAHACRALCRARVAEELQRRRGTRIGEQAARDLVASVAAIVAQVEGRQRMLDVLDLIDRATEA